MSSAEVKPGTVFERDGKKHEVVQFILANRFTSAAVEWRRPGEEFRISVCSLHAWTKWVQVASPVSWEGEAHA